MANLVVRIPWSTLRGTRTGIQELSFEITEDTKEGKTVVESLQEKVKPTVRRAIETIVERHAFSDNGTFQDLIIGTIEFLVIIEKEFKSLESLGIQDTFDQAILKKLREFAQRREEY